MNCPACCLPLAADAKFCGHCGASVPSATPPPPRPRAVPAAAQRTKAVPGSLEHHLYDLADALETATELPAHLQLATRAVAAGSGGERRNLVVMGSFRTGKTTLVNKLLQNNFLPIGRDGLGTVVHLDYSEAWSAIPPAHTAGQDIGDEALPALASGPAPFLQEWTLVDTPGLNTEAHDLEKWALREALRADAVIFCLHAHQCLSLLEQETISLTLLPLTTCPIILVVTHLDKISSESDLAELREMIGRFIGSAPAGRLSLFMPSRGSPEAANIGTALLKLVDDKAPAAINAKGAWLERVGLLLSALDAALPTPGVHLQVADADEATKRRDWLVQLLRREHTLAEDEACAMLNSEVGKIKMETTAILDPLPIESLPREGRATMERLLSRAGSAAASHYLKRLREGLALSSPQELTVAASQIDPNAVVRLPVSGPGPLPPGADRAHKRDWRSASLAGAGLAVSLYAGGWIRIVGTAVTLLASESWRRITKQQTQDTERAATVAAIKDWLGMIETSLEKKLREATSVVVAELEKSLTVQAQPAPSSPPPDIDDTLRTLLTRCQESFAQSLSSPSLP